MQEDILFVFPPKLINSRNVSGRLKFTLSGIEGNGGEVGDCKSFFQQLCNSLARCPSL